MSSGDVVARIVAERPWVIYVLLGLLDSGGVATASDVASLLGLNTYVVKRGMWWLKKYGLVEIDESSTPRRYRVKSLPPTVERLRSSKRVCGNTTVVEYGDAYIAFVGRRDEVVTHVVPRALVEALLRGEGAKAPPRLLAVARRVVDTIMCRR